MKTRLLFLISLYYIYTTHVFNMFAEWTWAPTGLLQWITPGWGKSASVRIKEGDLHLDDIPNVINAMINIFLWMAWTISVIFVIIGAYKLLFGSLKQDHTKWRETIVMALTGFAISVLAWFIVKFIFNNFSG